MRLTDSRSGLVFGDFPEWIFQEVQFCVARIFLLKSWEGSSRRLKRFWARYPISRIELADYRFPVSVGEGHSSVNKVLSGAPSQIPDLGVF